ncbi:hypothetical protein AVEN_237038-1 [Araneus ventricosus]|uniref:Uncharacterized protein n=1 Tax=Araneus ventricosus TaxID=182803 RepID=A0A4Y2S4W0_ARAVE|nr:hypothetical protein AVEN_237038-1 [Araneus ventricosus]
MCYCKNGTDTPLSIPFAFRPHVLCKRRITPVAALFAFSDPMCYCKKGTVTPCSCPLCVSDPMCLKRHITSVLLWFPTPCAIAKDSITPVPALGFDHAYCLFPND